MDMPPPQISRPQARALEGLRASIQTARSQAQLDRQARIAAALFGEIRGTLGTVGAISAMRSVLLAAKSRAGAHGLALTGVFAQLEIVADDATPPPEAAEIAAGIERIAALLAGSPAAVEAEVNKVLDACWRTICEMQRRGCLHEVQRLHACAWKLLAATRRSDPRFTRP